MMRIASGGSSWILLSWIITVVFLVAAFYTHGFQQVVLFILLLLLILISLLLMIFFRDPERTIGTGVVAVADGKIRELTKLPDAEVGDATRISTFMNIHNVHVNRMPLDGTVTSLTRQPGGHLPAFQKESDRNERVVILLQTNIGIIKVVQIAGAVARRIIPYVKPGDQLQKGARLGLIRLGSRVDLYLPTKKIKHLSIHVHDTIKAGEDTIAELHD
jgi:phosphatidylserine decarboxylase